MFIVLEGLDASGKSTQAKMLHTRMANSMLFKYPDRTSPLGHIIDRWLKGEVTLGRRMGSVTTPDGEKSVMTEDPDALLALQGLLLANKVEVQAYLLDVLNKKKDVIADRYTPSARAYGTADGLNDEWLEESHRTLVTPDVYILIDVTVEEAMRRRVLQGGGEHYESDRGRLERAAKKYREIARHSRSKHHWEIVDGMKPPDLVAQQVIFAVSRHTRGK